MSWKKIIKNAKLIPFPPGNTEENWMFPYDIVNERFVESPRNRRRLSTPHSHAPGHFEGMSREQRFLHMVETGLGVNHLEGIDPDDLDTIEGKHTTLPHI